MPVSGYFAIEVVGYGKTRGYVLKRVAPNKLVIPVNGIKYPNINAALRVAKELNLVVEKIGDLWEII